MSDVSKAWLSATCAAGIAHWPPSEWGHSLRPAFDPGTRAKGKEFAIKYWKNGKRDGLMVQREERHKYFPSVKETERQRKLISPHTNN
jgi:hypothetical protein